MIDENSTTIKMPSGTLGCAVSVTFDPITRRGPNVTSLNFGDLPDLP